MAITDDISTIWDEKEEREDFFAARAALENATRVANEELTKFKEIKAEGTFDTIPQNLKDAMLRWEAMFDDLKAAFLADQEVQDIYNWRP